MKKRLVRTVVGALAAAVCLTATAGSASALTVSPAGAVGAIAGATSWAANGITLTCTSSTLTGTLTAAGSGAITGASYVNCSNSSLGRWTLTPVLPWTVGMAATSTGIVTRFSNVAIRFAGSIGCSFTASGAQSVTNSGGSPLTVRTWAQLPANSRLVVSDSVGCLGLYNNGNILSFGSTHTLTTPQVVTYP